MSQTLFAGARANPLPSSPLILSDRLLALAEDADRAGMRLTAGRLVELACTVMDSPPPFRL